MNTLAGYQDEKVKANRNCHLTLNDYNCMYILLHTPSCWWHNLF